MRWGEKHPGCKCICMPLPNLPSLFNTNAVWGMVSSSAFTYTNSNVFLLAFSFFFYLALFCWYRKSCSYCWRPMYECLTRCIHDHEWQLSQSNYCQWEIDGTITSWNGWLWRFDGFLINNRSRMARLVDFFCWFVFYSFWNILRGVLIDIGQHLR